MSSMNIPLAGAAFRRVILGALAVVIASAAAPLASLAPRSAMAAAVEAEHAMDRLILKSGKVVEGEILEETDSMVRIRVIVAGISAPTTFQKSEILEITHGAAKEATEEKPAAAVKADSKATTTLKPRSSGAEAKPKAPVEPGAAQLYVVEMEGRFGLDVAETPLRQLFVDVDKTFDDLVDGVGAESGRKVVDPALRQDHILVIKVDLTSPAGMSTIFGAAKLAPVIMDEIVLKGRRIVFWVEQAAGGAAFLPWVSSEIYFTPEGLLGGIAEMDEFSSGDHMVDEKLIGAFLGAAEGYAIKGGYSDHLPALRAMIRRQNWLAVRFEGGKPVYLTRMPVAADGEGWHILSDSGKGDFKDSSARGGNDSFVLDAEWAVKLGIARGSADTVDDLAFALGIHRNYVELTEHRGGKILEDWKKRIELAIDQVIPNEQPGRPIGRLWREFNEIQTGGDFAQRKRDRGRKLALLRQIRSIVSQYAEVLDAEGTWRAQIDVQLAQLQLEAEQDARSNR